MRRLLPLLLAALLPASALAEGPPAPQGVAGGTPTGLVAAVSLGGGGELGLDSGKEAGVLELETLVGWELESVGLRPELAVAFGAAPDGNVAFRPGVRWSVPSLPIQLRAAFDVSNARNTGLRWRWLVVGAAAEVRFTSLLGLYGEVDTGAPLGSESGLPLLVRGGVSFRF